MNVLDVELQRALRLEPGGAQGALELFVAVVGVFVTAKLRWSPAGYFADLKEVNRRQCSIVPESFILFQILKIPV